MSGLARLAGRLHRVLLACYPADFRAEFDAEMQTVFSTAVRESEKEGWLNLLMFFGRESRDLLGEVWRERLRAQIGSNAMKPIEPIPNKQLTPRDTLAALAIFFGLPAFMLAMGRLPDWFSYFLVFTLLAIIAVSLVLGIIKGFPRWTVPNLGIVLTVIVLGPSSQLWGLLYLSVMKAIDYHTKTLQVRVLYQALRSGFFWSLVFLAAILLILLLMAWPRTRQFGQRIRSDWTLLSFLLYGSVVFAIVLVFEEYRYDEPWMIACYICLSAGAWLYLKGADPRKRFLALLTGVTLAYWVAAIGKWYLVPLQDWGAFHGYQYETYRWFEFWRTLAEWGWVVLFMLAPALLTLIPPPQESDPIQKGNLAPA